MWRSINKTIKNPEALTTLVRNDPHAISTREIIKGQSFSVARFVRS